MKENYINHIALVIDDSGSMSPLKHKVISIVRDQVRNMISDSKRNNQETRLSIYIFGKDVKNIAFDRDLVRVPDAGDYYGANQPNTALVDATAQAIEELGEISQKRDDHSFLIYVLTDGGENVNPKGGTKLRAMIDDLPENWTMAVLVPNAMGVSQAKQFGFPAKNIQIWETTEQGLGDVSEIMIGATSSYMAARSAGIKGTKSLFEFDKLSKTEVKNKLEEVDPGTYETLIVRKYDEGRAIKDFVEAWTKRPYRIGSAYYQVTKPEMIQAGKQIAVIEKATGRMFSGVRARSLLGLPCYEVKVAPADLKNFDIFVQSTSTNRKLVSDTHLIVFK